MKDLTKGVLGSFLIHGGLVAIFAFIFIDLKSAPPEFVEIILPSPPVSSEEEFIEEETPKKVELPEVEYVPREPEIVEPVEIEKEIPEEITPEKQVPSIGEDIDTEVYSIAGDLATRRVVNAPVPGYPEGYQIETKVSVRLFVLPDGSIERMRLVKRGGEPFDELTQRVLREWKFEPLPKETSQVTQEGVITFVYRLK